MPKRSRKTADPNSSGADAPKRQRPKKKPATERDPAAVALGRRGGLKGGKARAAKLTPEQRAESAKKAAAARWGTPKK